MATDDEEAEAQLADLSPPTKRKATKARTKRQQQQRVTFDDDE